MSFAEGTPESFALNPVSPTVRVGVPFDLSLQIKDRYGHSVMPPSNVQPVLKCR